MGPKRYFKLSIAFAIVLNLSTAVQAFDREPCSTFASTLYEAGNVTFLRDQYGRPTENFSDAWGISYEACKDLCPASSNLIDWSAFTNQLGSWPLPFLMLITQLPFQSASIWKNLQELLLAIGSPILIIYSLAVTIFNTRTIKKAFREVEEDNRSLERLDQIKLIKSVRRVLIESQSTPFRHFNILKRDLAPRVVNPENWWWWAAAAEELTMMRRGLTFPLVAAIACILFALCILLLELLRSEEVDPNLGTSLGITSLWLWLVPVTLGWPMVGGTSFPKVIPGPEYEKIELQSLESFEGTVKDTALDLEPRTVPQSYGGVSVIGAESEPGLFFNYARVWSHMRTSGRVIKAFRNFTHRQEQKIRTDGKQPWNDNDWEANLGGTQEQMLKYITATDRDFLHLPLHSNFSPGVLANCMKAAVIALTLGWATTGGSLLITYMYVTIYPISTFANIPRLLLPLLTKLRTPPVGIGCSSAGYLIYGVAATVSWLLLVTSAYLSDLYLNPNEAASFLSIDSSMFAAAAVYLRIFGKAVAFVNAVFLLVTSILQFTDLYSSCWCSSAVMSLGTTNGWVVLFATDSQIVAVSEIPWLIGFSMSGVASTVMLSFILRYRADSKDHDEEPPRIKDQHPNGLKRVMWKCVSILLVFCLVFFVDNEFRHAVRFSMMIIRSYDPVPQRN
jgi:hypothetical protein